MPIFDLACTACDWSRDDTFIVHALPVCPTCGSPTEKRWTSGFPAVIDDSIPGGLTIENLSAQPITVYSKSEHRIVMKQHGASLKVRHVGVPGSDKSPHTSRWV